MDASRIDTPPKIDGDQRWRRAIQLFALLALLLTSPASLICGLVAAWTRQWKNVGAFCCGAVLPVITCGLAVATNLPGWEAVMAI